MDVAIDEPKVAVPSPIEAIKPEPSGCTKLGGLFEPGAECAAPAGAARTVVIYPTTKRGSSDLPTGRFPVVLFSHGNNAPVLLYEGLLRRLAHEGFLVVALRCPSFARTAGDEAIWIERARAAIGWLERADAGLLPNDPVASKLAGHVALDRIGVVGHSRGATESVRLLGLEPRIKAGVVAAPAATNQGQCPQQPLCLESVIGPDGRARQARPTDAMDRCCHLSGLFSGAESSCSLPSGTTLPAGCPTGFRIWTPEIGGQVFANPIDLVRHVDKPLRVLAAEYDGAARPFGAQDEGTQGGFKRRPIQTSLPTGCFQQEEGDTDGNGTSWEYGYCDGGEAPYGAEQVFQANGGPSQFLVIREGLHCGFNQALGLSKALCDGPPNQKVLSFDLDPATGAPRELPHLDPQVQFELFTEAAVEFLTATLGGCEGSLWDAWYDIVPGYRTHLERVNLRPEVKIAAIHPSELSLPPGGEGRVEVTVHNAGSSPANVSFSLLGGPNAALPRCGASRSSWCLEAPADLPLAPGESRTVEIRVAAPEQDVRPIQSVSPDPSLPGARLFAQAEGGASSAGLALRLELPRGTEPAQRPKRPQQAPR